MASMSTSKACISTVLMNPLNVNFGGGGIRIGAHYVDRGQAAAMKIVPIARVTQSLGEFTFHTKIYKVSIR